MRRTGLSAWGAWRRRGRINRAPSPLLAVGVPWASIALASLVPTWLIIASAPVLPPFGYLFLIAWRQLRPGLLPVWSGLPLGLFDDLYSGQPLGCGVLLWSLSNIVLDIVEMRMPWRNFLMEWLGGGAMIACYILAMLIFANLAGGSSPVQIIVPQVVISILVYPFVGRIVAGLDRFRLLPLRRVH